MLNSSGQAGSRWIRTALLVLVLAGLQACAVTPYEPGNPEPQSMLNRAAVLQQNAFTVRASVPGEQEAETIFGFPIYERGIQPLWLEIRNDSPSRARFIITSVDDDYYSPFEVAYMNKKYFSKQGWMDMEKFLYRNAMPRMIASGESASGYVYTHVEPGTKNINVDIFHAADESRHEEFTFFLEVPGFVPDHADVDFKKLYTKQEITDTDPEGLKTLLETLPCCFSDRSGDGDGQPANVVLVGPGLNVLRALIRAGWSETSYEKDDNYLNNSNYLFGRPPDAVFRKSRGKTTERNELSLWLAPVRVDGEPVWLGQVRHAIGRRFEFGELFFGTALDPDINDGRNYLLQNLWYNRSLLAFAYSDTVPTVPASDPATDFSGNPWFSDGVRIVMWVSGEPVSLGAVRNLLWLKLPGQPELKP